MNLTAADHARIDQLRAGSQIRANRVLDGVRDAYVNHDASDNEVYASLATQIREILVRVSAPAEDEAARMMAELFIRLYKAENP